MNLFFKHINIPVPIMRDDFIFPEVPVTSDSYFHKKCTSKDLNPDFIAWLATKKLFPRIFCNLILFYAHPEGRTSVHTDTGGRDIWALNCPLSPGQFNVRWYSVESGVYKETDLKYIVHPESSTQIEHTLLSFPGTLTNISIPHSSDSLTGGWFLSLRCAPTNIKWDKLISRFE